MRSASTSAVLPGRQSVPWAVAPAALPPAPPSFPPPSSPFLPPFFPSSLPSSLSPSRNLFLSPSLRFPVSLPVSSCPPLLPRPPLSCLPTALSTGLSNRSGAGATRVCRQCRPQVACIHMYIYIYTYIHMYIYIYIHGKCRIYCVRGVPRSPDVSCSVHNPFIAAVALLGTLL